MNSVGKDWQGQIYGLPVLLFFLTMLTPLNRLLYLTITEHIYIYIYTSHTHILLDCGKLLSNDLQCLKMF